jgi:hypothetical protein
MTSDEAVPTEAVTSAADVSPSLPIGLQKPAEHMEALGEAVMQFAVPAARRAAVDVFGQRFEKVAQSLQQAADEAFRKQFELGMHFVEDLVLARSPAEVLKLQLAYFAAQFEFVAEQSKEMQSQFARAFLAPLAKSGAADKDGRKTV